MDAFAITGVSPNHEWFRVQAAVGGIESRARLFPRVHVLRSADIADLASGGRRIYFQQTEAGASLVPLAREDAAAFDAAHLPIEDVSRFAFLESATEEDIRYLLDIRHGRVPIGVGTDALERLESLEWIERDGESDYRLTAIGQDLLRHRLS
ncbi:MAG TPA: hypothetical protein VNE58_13830 [Casimicrobiaceae bacterium]|nr:hypothetical protein [Casimicrobiaceae bacterium]